MSSRIDWGHHLATLGMNKGGCPPGGKRVAMTLTIELTHEEAESILRANRIAKNEASYGRVAPRIYEAILEKWPDLKPEYAPGSPEDSHYYVLATKIASQATHKWVAARASVDSAGAVITYNAAPEENGCDVSKPFATAIMQRDELAVLLPASVCNALNEALLGALQDADILHRAATDAVLHAAKSVVVNRWWQLIDMGAVWYDAYAEQWVVDENRIPSRGMDT